MMTFHSISATDKDDPNAEYFFGCSGGEFEKVKELIEADPSLANTGKSEFVLFYDMNSCVQYKASTT